VGWWFKQKAKPSPNNQRKKARGVAQAVKCLTSKYKTLSSNSSTTKQEGGGKGGGGGGLTRTVCARNSVK
jgi:hypothetical protein